MRRRLLAALVATALGLVILELGVRLAEALAPEQESVAFADRPHQSESRKSENPVLGWELDPAGSEVNSEAFRDREVARERTPGVKRIALIGDSVAFGHGLPVEQGVADRLEAALGAGYEVLNFGVGGYNTIQTAELYATKGRLFSPDLVVLLYVLNDALPAKRMAKLADIVRYRRSFEEPAPLGLRSLKRALEVAERIGGPDAESTAPYVRETHEDPKTWRIVQRGLTRIAQIARADGAETLLVITPLFFELEGYAFADIHARVAEAGRRRGFRVLDLAKHLGDVEPRLLRLDPRDVTHPSALGHERIAAAIASHIRDRKAAPSANAD